MSVLDALLEGAEERATLAEDAGTRARWAKWEAEHGGLKKGSYAHSQVGGLVQVTHPPGLPGEVASHHVGKVGVKGSSGGMRVPAEGLTPAGDIKLKKAATKSSVELSRHEVHHNGTHIADLVRTEGSGRVMSGSHQVGSTRHRFWNHTTPGGPTPSTGSGHTARASALDRLFQERQKKASGLKEGADASPFTAPLEELAPSKPGTNWKQVTPENRKKVDPLVKHWMGHAHPFTACYNELAPEKGSEAAKRICAVVKDMGMRTTKWRSGGKKVKEETAREAFEFYAQSVSRLAAVEAAFGRGSAPVLAEVASEEEAGRKLAEMCFSDLCVIAALREVFEGAALQEAPGDFDAADLLAKVRNARRWRELPPHRQKAILDWTVMGPPDSPTIPIEPGGVIEDDRTRRQKAQGFGALTAFKAAHKTSSTRARAPAATPTGITGTASTSRDRWAKWDKVHSGQSGAPVQGVQAAVGAKTDGVFGSKTQAAVRRYQAKNGLQVDGIVGRQTYAAFAGRKGASGIKVGKLSHAQVSHLASFSRHGGTLLHPRRRKLHASADTAERGSLQELMLLELDRATPGDFPDRVRGLKQGEVARMPDGIAVRRASTLDGRDIFQVGEPSTYGDVPGDVRYYSSDHHRQADHAIADAGRRSARRGDPASLGGASRFHRHTSVQHRGQDVTFLGVDHQLRPQVRSAADLSAAPKIVSWGDLKGRPLTEDAELAEADLEEAFKKKLSADPRGKHQAGHVVRFESAMRDTRTSDKVRTRPGVITGFHKQSHDPIVKDLASNIERIIPRKSIVSTHGPLSGHSGVSNWAKWNAEHPERTHRRLVASVAEVTDDDAPFLAGR